jgi:hypothetical protein
VSFIDRLMQFKRPEESNRAFCRRIGIPPQQLRNWQLSTPERPVQPKISTIVPLAERLGVTLGWLAAGEGENGTSNTQ